MMDLSKVYGAVLEYGTGAIPKHWEGEKESSKDLAGMPGQGTAKT